MCAYSVFYRRLRSYASVLLASIDSYYRCLFRSRGLGLPHRSAVSNFRVALQFIRVRPGVFGQ